MERESDCWRWDELTPDVLGLTFKNLELQEVLQVIPMVCKSWCKVVNGPYGWETIDIDEWSKRKEDSPEQLDRMLRTLITRSSGSLRELKSFMLERWHVPLHRSTVRWEFYICACFKSCFPVMLIYALSKLVKCIMHVWPFSAQIRFLPKTLCVATLKIGLTMGKSHKTIIILVDG